MVPSARQLLRLVVVWLVAVLLSSVVLLAASQGEPVCEGPLILDVDDSDPPQCDDPIDGLLAQAGPLFLIGLVVACLAEAVYVVARTLTRRRRSGH